MLRLNSPSTVKNSSLYCNALSSGDDFVVDISKMTAALSAENSEENAQESYSKKRRQRCPVKISIPVDKSNYPRKWTKEEDERLRQSVSKIIQGGKNAKISWPLVADYVETRDNVQCLQRWKKALKPGLKKGTWSDQEDALLTKLESQMPHVFKNWGKLAAHMPGRTSKQCRERWRQYLDPRLNRSLFSPQEDERLIQLYEKLGKQWSLIAKHLDGRTENSVCSRIKALMNKMKRTALLNDLRAKIKASAARHEDSDDNSESSLCDDDDEDEDDEEDGDGDEVPVIERMDKTPSLVKVISDRSAQRNKVSGPRTSSSAVESSSLVAYSSESASLSASHNVTNVQGVRSKRSLKAENSCISNPPQKTSRLNEDSTSSIFDSYLYDNKSSAAVDGPRHYLDYSGIVKAEYSVDTASSNIPSSFVKTATDSPMSYVGDLLETSLASHGVDTAHGSMGAFDWYQQYRLSCQSNSTDFLYGRTKSRVEKAFDNTIEALGPISDSFPTCSYCMARNASLPLADENSGSQGEIFGVLLSVVSDVYQNEGCTCSKFSQQSSSEIKGSTKQPYPNLQYNSMLHARASDFVEHKDSNIHESLTFQSYLSQDYHTKSLVEGSTSRRSRHHNQNSELCSGDIISQIPTQIIAPSSSHHNHLHLDDSLQTLRNLKTEHAPKSIRSDYA